jgi:hypothetical protein
VPTTITIPPRPVSVHGRPSPAADRASGSSWQREASGDAAQPRCARLHATPLLSLSSARLLGNCPRWRGDRICDQRPREAGSLPFSVLSWGRDGTPIPPCSPESSVLLLANSAMPRWAQAPVALASLSPHTPPACPRKWHRLVCTEENGGERRTRRKIAPSLVPRPSGAPKLRGHAGDARPEAPNRPCGSDHDCVRARGVCMRGPVRDGRAALSVPLSFGTSQSVQT